MSSKEIKKLALSKLGGTPLSYKFVFFAFLIRVILSIFEILSLSFNYIILNSGFSPQFATLSTLIIYIAIPILYILFGASIDKKLILNSNGTINYDLREFKYYINNTNELVSLIGVDFFKFIFSILWLWAATFVLLIFGLVLAILFPNMQPGAAVFFIPLVLAAIAVVGYKFLSYSMARYIKIENNEFSAMDCIIKSKAMMANNVKSLFLLVLSFLGWFVLSFLSLGIIYPFVLAYLRATILEFYNSVKTDDAIKTDINESEKINITVNVSESIPCYDDTKRDRSTHKTRIALLILTIIISLASFVGINYYNNKYYIDKFIQTGSINFDDGSYDTVITRKDLISGKEYNVRRKNIFRIGLY